MKVLALVLGVIALAWVASRASGRAAWAPANAPAEPGLLVTDGGR